MAGRFRGAGAPKSGRARSGRATALLAASAVFAGPLTAYTAATAEQLFQPDAYINTVMGGQS